jgi:hypothetical protein
LAPEHPLVQEQLQNMQLKETTSTLASSKRSERERMADVKRYQEYSLEPMLSIRLQRANWFGWGLCVSRLRNRSCNGGTLWWRAIMLLLIF